MSALSDLFTDIASAIRGKTGETGTMKPAEFPDKIAGIEAGGGGLGGVWKFATKTFTALEGQTFISHNCNVVPDIVILSAKTQILDTNNYSGLVYASGFSSRYLEFLKANNGKAYGEALITGMAGSDEYGYTGNIVTHYNDIAIESSSGYILGATSTKIGFAEALIDGASYEAKLMWFTGTFDAEEPSPMIKYVSFMNGTQLLFKMPVLVGDDCKNPVSTGDISTPKKESTEQYDYTFAGWGTNSSAVNSSCLKNVLTDRTVYAVFNSSIRYYTVTFYDDDGTTVLQTLSVAYGGTPNPENPEKQGYSFSNWNPDLTTVTGDTSYQAVWSSNKSFNDSSWSEIQTAVNNKAVGEQWAVGATKDITLTWEDGTTTDVKVEIARYNLKSFFANTTLFLISDTLMPDLIMKGSAGGGRYTDSENATYCDIIYNYLNTTIKNALPEDMRNVVDKITIPDCDNMGYGQHTYFEENSFYHFDCFTEDSSSRIKTLPDGTAYQWWVDGKTTSGNIVGSTFVTATGAFNTKTAYGAGNGWESGVLPVFEIKPKT